jgi:gluconolactonase
MSFASRTCIAAAIFTVFSSAQDFSEVKFDKLAQAYRFPEGPAWSKEGYLLFSDIPSDRLLKWVPGHDIEVFRTDAHGPSGNAFDVEGRLYTCETRTGRVTRTDKKGKIDVLAEKWDGKRFNAPSHIAVGKNGNAYFTDPAFGAQQDRRELDFYGVYHIPPKGPVTLVAKPAGRPNGIALSPNGRTLYVANSDERNVRAYDVDKNGDTSGERLLIPKIDGVPGGIGVDEKGNLYIAVKGIAVYSADGKPIHVIEMHDAVSDCAFGEIDNKSLIITARGVVYRARMDGKGAN